MLDLGRTEAQREEPNQNHQL